MTNFQQQMEKLRSAPGFIAALDQSGGSTPKALKLYGVAEGSWGSDAEMMDLMHAMRSRIITSRAFGGERLLAAILFEATMDREIEGLPTAEYLWQVKQVVPILKVDKGLEAEAVDVLSKLADALRDAGRGRDALAALEEIVRIVPRDARLRERLGRLLQEEGRREDALAEYRAALDLCLRSGDPAGAEHARTRVEALEEAVLTGPRG